MTLTTTFKVGGLTCHTLEGGRQRLDGGAMFGVVPRPLWEREIAPDERNRIPLAMRCLLVEHSVGLVLVDSGLGNKESEKFKQIYGIENAGHRGPTQLEDALAELTFSPADIRYVINTHLHFDHAGGNTKVGAPTAMAELSFPRATYVVQKREIDFASHTNERTAASYLPHNWVPIAAAGRWQLVDGEAEVLPGIRVLPTPGHVPFHQSIVVADRGETACFLGDLVPTTAHLPLPWIMGYDLEPLVTLESKRHLLTRAEAEGWRLVFEHDPVRGVGRVVKDGKAFRFAPVDTPSGRA
ncbi:MAG TPA: MBL fold metallo-hydrolase [Gemmatimonadales bacterium]|jgi:glyoxylase-like metal-dependent hydrolase (beta-lactamase superfamily II)